MAIAELILPVRPCDANSAKRLLHEPHAPPRRAPACRVLDQLVDLADYDKDGLINYAEFARLITAEDVVNMKDSLSGETSATRKPSGRAGVPLRSGPT